VQSKLILTCCSQLMVMSICWAPAHAALPQVTPKPASIAAKQQTPKAISPKDIQQKITEIDQKIKASQEAENEQTAQQLGVNLSLLQKRTGLLMELRAAYEGWSENLEKEAVIEKEHKALTKKVTILKEQGVTEPPPHSLSLYDDLLSKRQFFAQRQEGYALSNSLFSEHLDFLREKREEVGKRWRLLKDKLAAATLPQEQKKLRFEVEVTGLEKELAETKYLSAKIYRHIFELLQEMARQRAEVYRAQATWVKKHLLIQDSDLADQMALLAQKQAKLDGKQAKLQRAMQDMAKKCDRVDKELPASSPLREEISQEKQIWRHTQQSISKTLMDHLNILRFTEDLWKKRIALLKGEASQEQLVKWQAVSAKKEKSAKNISNTSEIKMWWCRGSLLF
jgi:hypothetical protein